MVTQNSQTSSKVSLRRFGTKISTNTLAETDPKQCRALKKVRVRRNVPAEAGVDVDTSRTKSITFLPGPVGLQLEPVNETSRHNEYAAKVVRFVDGGPKDPGQARKSGDIRPGDLVIRAEAPNTVGTTYESIIKVLKTSHSVRELTFIPAWESINYSLHRTCAVDGEARSSTSNGGNTTKLPQGKGAKNRHLMPLDLQSSTIDIEKESSCQDSVEPRDEEESYSCAGPLIIPLTGEGDGDGDEKSFLRRKPQATTHTETREVPLAISPENCNSQRLTFDDSMSSRHVGEVCTERTPLKPPRSRFAVGCRDDNCEETCSSLLDGDGNSLHKVLAGGCATEEEKSFSPSNVRRLASIYQDWKVKPKSLSDAIGAVCGRIAPTIMNSYSIRPRISTRIVSNAGGTAFANGRASIFVAKLESQNDVHETKKNLLRELSKAKAALDSRDVTNQQWQENMDSLFNENVALHQNFEEKLRLTRAEHEKTERELKELYSAMSRQRDARIRELEATNEELRKSITATQVRQGIAQEGNCTEFENPFELQLRLRDLEALYTSKCQELEALSSTMNEAKLCELLKFGNHNSRVQQDTISLRSQLDGFQYSGKKIGEIAVADEFYMDTETKHTAWSALDILNTGRVLQHERDQTGKEFQGTEDSSALHFFEVHDGEVTQNAGSVKLVNPKDTPTCVEDVSSNSDSIVEDSPTCVGIENGAIVPLEQLTELETGLETVTAEKRNIEDQLCSVLSEVAALKEDAERSHNALLDEAEAQTYAGRLEEHRIQISKDDSVPPLLERKKDQERAFTLESLSNKLSGLKDELLDVSTALEDKLFLMEDTLSKLGIHNPPRKSAILAGEESTELIGFFCHTRNAGEDTSNQEKSTYSYASTIQIGSTSDRGRYNCAFDASTVEDYISLLKAAAPNAVENLSKTEQLRLVSLYKSVLLEVERRGLLMKKSPAEVEYAHHVNKLQYQLKEAERERNGLRECLTSIEFKLERIYLESQRKTVFLEIEKRRSSMANTAAHTDRSHNQLDTARRECDELRGRLATVESEFEDVTAKAEQIRHASQWKAVLLEVEKRGLLMANAAAETERLRQVERSHNQLDTARRECDELRGRLATVESEFEDVTAKAEQIRHASQWKAVLLEVEKRGLLMANAAAETERLRQVERSQNQLDTARRECDELRGGLATVESEFEDVTAKAEKICHASQWKAVLLEVEKRGLLMANAAAETERLRQVERSQNQLDTARRECDELRGRLATVESEFEDVTAKAEKICHASQWKAVLLEVEKRGLLMANAAAETERLRQVERSHNQLDTARRECDELRGRLATVESEFEDVTAKAEQIRHASQWKAVLLEVEKRGLLMANAAAETERLRQVERSHNQLDTARRECDELRGRLATVESEFEDVTAKAEQIRHASQWKAVLLEVEKHGSSARCEVLALDLVRLERVNMELNFALQLSQEKVEATDEEKRCLDERILTEREYTGNIELQLYETATKVDVLEMMNESLLRDNFELAEVVSLQAGLQREERILLLQRQKTRDIINGRIEDSECYWSGKYTKLNDVLEILRNDLYVANGKIASFVAASHVRQDMSREHKDKLLVQIAKLTMSVSNAREKEFILLSNISMLERDSEKLKGENLALSHREEELQRSQVTLHAQLESLKTELWELNVEYLQNLEAVEKFHDWWHTVCVEVAFLKEHIMELEERYEQSFKCATIYETSGNGNNTPSTLTSHIMVYDTKNGVVRKQSEHTRSHTPTDASRNISRSGATSIMARRGPVFAPDGESKAMNSHDSRFAALILMNSVLERKNLFLKAASFRRWACLATCNTSTPQQKGASMALKQELDETRRKLKQLKAYIRTHGKHTSQVQANSDQCRRLYSVLTPTRTQLENTSTAL